MKLKYIRYSSLLIVLIALSNIIGFLPSAGILYPITMAVTLIFYLVSSSKFLLNIPMFSIVIVAVISTLINNPPVYFHSWERLGLFVIVAGVVSPLFRNKRLFLLRQEMFKWLLILSVIVTTLSFIGYFFGINYAFQNYIGEVAAHFGGITIHSMILGPIASISMCYLLYLISTGTYLSKKNKYLFIGLMIISFLTILLAASRAALAGGIVGCLFLIFKNNKAGISRVAGRIVTLSLLLIATFPLWNSFTTRIQEKQKYGIEQGNFAASRESKWENRINEFKSSPLWGIGYFAASENTTDDFNKLTGQVEPGSSWLAVLSMLGLLGFVPFLYLFGSNLIYLYKDHTKYSALLGSILIFFMVHMFAEGYVFGAGGFMFFCLWLTIGTITAYRESKNITIVKYEFYILSKYPQHSSVGFSS